MESTQPSDFPSIYRDFVKMFPDEASCVAYLERLRWQPILSPKPIRFTDTLGSLKNKINLRVKQSRYPVKVKMRLSLGKNCVDAIASLGMRKGADA